MSLLARRKYNPISPLFSEMDSLFDDFWTDPWRLSAVRPSRATNAARYPIRNSKTEDGTLQVEFDVPGADKEDIEILYDEESGMLSVSSKTQETTSEDGKSVLRHTFSYQFYAPGVDVESVEAICDKGVLVVTGKPIEKQPQKKRIEIK